jgi:pilus assembly protein CpaB
VRSKSLIMVGLAIAFGVMAIFAGHRWLERQAALQRTPQPIVTQRPAETTIVVATTALKFGTEITHSQLAEIPWLGESLPNGAFRSVSDILNGQGRRVALGAVEINEPILKAKITGPGQRASLAAVIEQGMKAVTVRVNDVHGVAGFVLPGERVDILLTRSLEKDAYADVILQNIRVLAVDQSADDRTDKPAVVKAVTLEVNTTQAQKLTLASTVGTLSLALRAAGERDLEIAQRVKIEDLFRGTIDPTPVAAIGDAPARRATATVTVIRAMKREKEEYSVPMKP